ncbi:MAG: hypothetical protein CMJ32_01070 [Phycisphaerae bacterium]|nr:hypothetical protein [Phycisphaerae bacterium]
MDCNGGTAIPLDMAEPLPLHREMSLDSSILQLTTALSAGDPAALAAFYDRYYDFVLQEARRMTRRDEAFCLDVVQDTFMKVIRHLRPMSDEANLRGWLCRVQLNVARDHLRAEIRRSRREVSITRTDQHRCSTPEDLAWLRQRLQELDAEASQLLTWRFGLGMSLRRIGELTGLSTSTVDGRIRKSIELIRNKESADA